MSQPKTRQPYLDRADIVIVGNGIAGLTAAVEARRLAPEKRIVMVTDQIHPTINTPALKQFAIAKLTREQLLAYPAGTERAERIHVVTSRVEEIHARSKYISLSGNRGFGYDRLLIATGSYPMGLPSNLPGRDFDGVLTLHKLQDYLDLRRRIGEISEAIVIGGGVHAIETVMGLQYWGIRVHWLIRSKTFLSRMLDQTASDMVLDRIRRAGVIVHTETEVVGIMGRVGAVAGVITNQNAMIPCQLVLTCTGTQPRETLAERCTLELKHKKGILVDDQLHSSIPDIYAAGDVAALKNPQTGEYEPRAQWYAAVSQGRIAGAMLAGQADRNEPFGVQWHATHLGELSMLIVGEPLSKSSKVTTLTDTSSNGYRRMTIYNDRLVGYLSLGMTQPDSLSIKRIVDEGHSIRDITKALLKGNFDARKYLSQQRSQAARGMLKTGQLPPANRPYNPVSHLQLQSTTGRLETVGSGGTSPQVERRMTEPLPAGASLKNSGIREDAFLLDEGVNPFTGNLPDVGNEGRPKLEEEVDAFTGNLPLVVRTSTPPYMEEEINAFTGNLPALQRQNTSGFLRVGNGAGQGKSNKVIESTLVPIESPDWQPDKNMGIKKVQAQPAPARQPATEAEESTGRPSRSIWSYTNAEKLARGERTR